MPLDINDMAVLREINQRIDRLEDKRKKTLKNHMASGNITREINELIGKRNKIQREALFKQTDGFQPLFVKKEGRFEMIVAMIRDGATDDELKKAVHGLDKTTIKCYRHFFRRRDDENGQRED